MESIANKLNELVISQLEERQFEVFNKFITELKESKLLEDENSFDDFVNGFKKKNKKITHLVQRKTVKNSSTSSGQNKKKTDKKPSKKRAPNAFSYISRAYKTLEFQTMFQEFIMTQEEIEDRDLIGRGSHLKICGIVLNRIKDNEEALELYNSQLEKAVNEFNESSESSSESDNSVSNNQQNNDSDSEEEEIQVVTKHKSKVPAEKPKNKSPKKIVYSNADSSDDESSDDESSDDESNDDESNI